MDRVSPETRAELAEVLRTRAARRETIALGGAFTKKAMAGPACPASIAVSTSRLDRILEYTPQDLTISVEAGVRWDTLQTQLAGHRQMIPLDPPFFDRATVGGVIASNCSGPRRRLYGTARDFVIGMTVVTLEGKAVSSGGLVVKNVAGLDMAKTLIGSFGTLAAIAVVNFKLVPVPSATRTFLLRSEAAAEAAAARDRILRSVLQPAAIDLLNPAASARAGREGWLLALQAGGNPAVLDRYARELAGAEALEGPEESRFWDAVREFVPGWLAEKPEAATVRCAAPLTAVAEVMTSLPGPAIARAGSGVCYGCFETAQAAAEWTAPAAGRGWKPVIEFAPESARNGLDQWPAPGPDLEMMQRVKAIFDPDRLLNRGRMYGRF